MKTFAALIDLWPKPVTVTFAADLSVPPGTVRQWRSRSVLPDRVWRKVVESARMRGIEGVTLEVLAEIAEVSAAGVAAEVSTEAASAGEAA